MNPLSPNDTAQAMNIIPTLPRGVVLTQLATPNAMPESTMNAVPIRSIIAEELKGSRFGLGGFGTDSLSLSDISFTERDFLTSFTMRIVIPMGISIGAIMTTDREL